jgi:hypothetical protein
MTNLHTCWGVFAHVLGMVVGLLLTLPRQGSPNMWLQALPSQIQLQAPTNR